MAKKQQIILLHGNEQFVDNNLIVQGELVIEHGSGAENVKLHTLDKDGKIATFASQAYVDSQVATLSGDTVALGETVAAMDEAYKLADAALSAATDANAAAISAETEAREAAIAAEASARTEAIAAAMATLSADTTALGETVAANTEAIAKLNGGVDEDGSVAKAVNDAKIAITEAYEAADTQVREAFAAADTLLNNAITGLSAEFNTYSAATNEKIAALEAKDLEFEGLLSAETEAREADVAALSAATVANATAIAAETSARTEAIAVLDEKISGATDDLSALESKVTKLIGDDADASVRDIANNELAKILISGSTATTEALDTLQEIADWIQKHPEDAAAMNTAISANTAAIAAETSARTESVAALDERVVANAAAISAETAAREEAVSALTEALESAAKAATTKVVEGTDVNDNLSISSATTEDGAIVYTVNLDNVAKADELSALDERVGVVESTFVKEVKVNAFADGEVVESVLTGNTIDLTVIVIDGGTY